MPASESRTTTDHDEIRIWVEEHDGKPASVKGRRAGTKPVCCASIFPAVPARTSCSTSAGRTWFEKFDASELAFLYQESKADGEDSTFFKLVNR